MSQFIQLHLLTSYPPANLNRDDFGRPKTAMMGGVQRLRVSSQSLKRHWRLSSLFEEALAEHNGKRTRKVGAHILQRFADNGVDDNKAKKWALPIVEVFGKVDKKETLETQQLVHISPAEFTAIDALIDLLSEESREASKEELALLIAKPKAVDIALFGRMLASDPTFNMDAACQVAHALSVHAVTVEDDFFTAVDDLNTHQESGSAHLGETGFAAAVFYSYVCIDKTQLIANLNGDSELANKAIAALTEAAVKVAPSGKQNSFGSRAYASYVLAEIGEQQPRSLSVAFLAPVRPSDDVDMVSQAIAALEKQRDNFNAVYSECTERHYSLNAVQGQGRFDDLIRFLAD